MGTLTFSKIAAAILASVSTGGALHTTAATGIFYSSGAASNQDSNSNLTEICLKGKLDLSLWKDIGNEDDEEEEEDEEEDEDQEELESVGGIRLKAKKSRKKDDNSTSPPPLPPPSPILAPLLGTKSKKEKAEKEAAGSIKRTLSPIPILPGIGTGMVNNNSLGVPPNISAGVQQAIGGGSEHQQQSHHHQHRQNNNLKNNNFCVGRVLSQTPLASSSSAHKSHYGSKAIELGVVGGVTPTPSTLDLSSGGGGGNGGAVDGGSARHDASQVSLLRQQNQQLANKTTTLVTTGSSIISEQGVEGKPQEVQAQEQKLQAAQPLLPLLSSFIGSTQLSRGSQLPKGGGSGRIIKSARKVEFTTEQILIMEQQAAVAAAEQSGQGVGDKEKAKRGESAKDGSIATRSRSGSAIRRPSSRTVPTDILQEIRKMSLASQDAIEEKKKQVASGSAPGSGRKFGKTKKHKRRKPEEVFTDKDRAAAVTLGSKDIKQSLKAKKKRDRKMRLSISFLSGEDYVIGALLGEASYQMRVKKQPEAALNTLNKALEIQPNHKGALVARSQCYLKLGNAEAALKDAELTWDPNNQNDRYIQGLYQYAEALYQLGEFEKSLIAFHRGHRIRKDQDGFRIGIQKCQEAIKRAIGDRKATSIPNLDMVLPLIQEFDETKSRMTPEEKREKNDEQVLKNIVKFKDEFVLSSPADMKVKSKLITRELMGQLYLDKSYLKKFITRPEVINQQGLAKGLRDEACEALNYLESRERFWRQQNPLYSRKNFKTMLKAHAHDTACREQSIGAEPGVAKYLQRRTSCLMASSPPLIGQEVQLKRRSSSEVVLSQQQKQHQRLKSVERGSVDKTEQQSGIDSSKGKNGGHVKCLIKTASIESVRSKNNNRA